MERKYLSGNIRERLQDLMKERKITQSELAAKIGMDVSTLSRFISNATGKLGDENIKKIAKEFEVSTDFLLGVTDIPDRMNYDIAELGLSVQAAKNLYTGKVNAEVVNRLLENKNFAAMTNMIAHYFDDTLAAGYAAQNQMYATLSALLRGEAKQHPEDREAITEAAKTVSVSRMPMYQADLTAIQNTFMNVLKEIKKEIGSNVSDAQAMSKEAAQHMVIRDVLDRFLDELPAETRKIFVRRYFYMSPVKEIADEYGLSESKVTVTLFRTRGKLKSVLEKEGITL